MILIIGSNPSRLNTDPLVPFKGSRSEPIFRTWLEQLKLDEYEVINVSDIVCHGRAPRVSEWNLERLRGYCNRASKIIALGRTAEKAAQRVTNKEIYYLPHPSPANYALNNKIYIDNMLQNCYAYIWSI